MQAAVEAINMPVSMIMVPCSTPRRLRFNLPSLLIGSRKEQ